MCTRTVLRLHREQAFAKTGCAQPAACQGALGRVAAALSRFLPIRTRAEVLCRSRVSHKFYEKTPDREKTRDQNLERPHALLVEGWLQPAWLHNVPHASVVRTHTRARRLRSVAREVPDKTLRKERVPRKDRKLAEEGMI